ncbi:sel1 repeat family protein [Candidatus Sulfurimonas marisnigri]|uniref:beta-lactamase n=1 Tax=Candidatus Sulfurimonas marisnigri TaxID=2740405 RepID=A0A7S7LZZ9_9BACT|nr:tetratricopeptide repeat protein [Candidatus Sulfurimonas marisnigri]QOY54018.1 sel1 repeat family protein [Candidatus Sulfurimonas marisnigri]
MKSVPILIVLLFMLVQAEDSLLKNQTKIKHYFTKEAERYTTECNQGNLEACNKLGNLYNSGMGVKQDVAKSIELFSRACQGNIPYACTNLGIKYRVDFLGVKKDNAKAVEYFSKACSMGDSNGCHRLAVMYYDGIEVEKDYSKAVKLYEKACNSVYGSISCYSVVKICNLDNSIKESYIDLASSYTKSCEKDDMQGCFKLGQWYDKGIGVERNTSKAMELYEKSCDGKIARGCNEAGKKYSQSRNPEDKAKGFNLFLKSSEMNNAEAFRYIGLTYTGNNIDQNYTKAQEFLKKSCELKDIVGCSYYDTLSAQGY